MRLNILVRWLVVFVVRLNVLVCIELYTSRYYVIQWCYSWNRCTFEVVYCLWTEHSFCFYFSGQTHHNCKRRSHNECWIYHIQHYSCTRDLTKIEDFITTSIHLGAFQFKLGFKYCYMGLKTLKWYKKA